MANNDLERLFEFVMTVGERRLTRDVGFVYLFAQTDDNREGPIRAVSEREVAEIGICGRQAGPGFSGFESWAARAAHHGLREDRVTPVGTTETKPLNTLTEAEALVRHCIRKSLKRVAIVAPRWHLTRCVMSFVGEASRQRADVSVVPWLGEPMDLNEIVVHSQGELRARRSDLMFYEALRIQRYSLNRDLPDPEEVLGLLQYLRAAITAS